MKHYITIHKKYNNESIALERSVMNYSSSQPIFSGLETHSTPANTSRKALTGCGMKKKGKRKVQGVPQSQTAALPRPQEEKETDKSKQAQTEQTYEKH